MTQEKKRAIQGTPSCLKPWTYEARLRRERAQRKKAQRERIDTKLETFVSELKADGIRYFIYTNINDDCNIKIYCTKEQVVDMLTGFASSVQDPVATYLGLQFVAHGIALLKKHNKQAFEDFKRKIDEL